MRYAVSVMLGVVAATGCERLLDLNEVHARDASPVMRDVAVDVAADGSAVDPCLVAWYRFEDPSTMIDETGRYDGTLEDPPPTVTVGHVGNGYAFDGSASAQITDSAPFQVGPHTVSVWFEPSDVSNTHCLLSQLVRSGTNDLDVWQLCIDGNYLKVFADPSPSSTPQLGPLTAGQWYHATVVLDAGPASRLWLASQGQPVAETPLGFTPQWAGSDPLVVGADSDQLPQLKATYSGVMDELKVYSCALSDPKISAL